MGTVFCCFGLQGGNHFGHNSNWCKQGLIGILNKKKTNLNDLSFFYVIGKYFKMVSGKVQTRHRRM